MRIACIGTQRQIGKTLGALQKSKMKFKIVSLGDARFSEDSLLNLLTERQLSAMSTAFKLGYYDTPRRTSSEQIAKELRIHSSALVAHRRKAERRLLAAILKESLRGGY